MVDTKNLSSLLLKSSGGIAFLMSSMFICFWPLYSPSLRGLAFSWLEVMQFS